MSTATKDLEGEIIATLKTAREIAAAAEKDGRDFTPEEREKVQKSIEAARELKSKLDAQRDDADLRAQMKTLGDTIGVAGEGEGERVTESGLVLPGKGATMGERFVNAPEFKDWIKQNAPNGQIPDSRKGLISPPVMFGGLNDVLGKRNAGRKALITGGSATSAGALVFDQDLGLVDEGAEQRPLTLFDLITRGTTSSDTVSYARVTGFTNAAAEVAEATAATGTSGTKPESTLTLERVTAPVRTIAHWIPATTRSLSDAGQIRTLIDNFLRYGLRELVETQVIQGDGTGEEFEGIANASGVQTQAWDTDLLTTTRKAKTKVKVVGRASATGYAMHPNDAERLDLLQDANDRFYFGGPGDDGVQRLWRLPVVESEAIPEGVGYVGDWRQAVLWDREQASIQVSDSHSDFFVRNLVAILAEMRAAFGIFRPSAFVEIDLTA